MTGTIFLTIALAWLTGCDGPPSQDSAIQATYLVGNDVTDEPIVEACLPDDEMCGGEAVEMPAKVLRHVKIELHVLHTPCGFIGNIGGDFFINTDQAQSLVKIVRDDSDHGSYLVSHPTLLICSGQEAKVTIQPSHFPPYTAGGITFDPPPGVPELKGLSVRARPCISADGRFVQLDLAGSTTFCQKGQCSGASQTCTSQIKAVVPDGKTAVLRGLACPSRPCDDMPFLSGLPVIGEMFQFNCAKPENIVMVATVHIVNDAGHPVAQTTCTRDCQPIAAPVACCEPQPLGTVESNLEKLQTAKELYDLALLYERLNLVDVASKILCNVQEVCPGSRIAGQAQEHSTSMLVAQDQEISNSMDQAIINAMNQAQTLEELIKESEKIYGFAPTPVRSNRGVSQTRNRMNGEEEAEPPATGKEAKINRILRGYRQACSNGHVDRARQLAIEALAIDPTCFAK